MSRLTSRAPFNRPSALDVLPPRPGPLSPPETEMESGLAMPQEPRQEDTNSVTPEAAAQQAPMAAESSAGHFRRVSHLAYTTSSLSRRETRPTQRQSRWLVMVVPPTSLSREPPTLGHTLSSAPAGRFSSGILMPLFPTLYGQLTAIAREFNMPSTTGLCIYLQLQESGASMLTPRISDESWQLLWGHFFVGDDRAAQLPPHGLPISGRIEFDIDLRRARWFDAWMGHPRRERAESEIVSREPSVAPTHWRGDSRTSLFPTELGVEESPSPPGSNPPVPVTAISSRTVVQRQLPRPLLLERRDAASIRSFSRHASQAPSISHEPPSPDAQKQELVLRQNEALISKALSPVVQEQEEPPTARKIDLQTKVHQWRQSSSVTGAASNALAAAGQPSLDPVNMPSGADVELDLNDFAWSMSSAGPPSESPMSVDWSEPLPSVHLLGRLQGSVCLTPSVATSFGPLDDDWLDSPVSCVSRRPSPDLGMRMMDYVPLTPTTATSWGPDDTPSPIYSEFQFQYGAPSVDIGVRGMGSRPMTPSTATSWGPDDSPSPIYSDFEFEYRAPSVDIGVRGMGSRPVTPSTATTWGPPDSPLTLPPSPYYVRTPDAGERAFPDLEVRTGAARAMAFQYYSAWEGQPWGHVWPYQAHRRRVSAAITLSAPTRRMRKQALLPEWPDFASLYPSDPSVERAAGNKSLPVELLREAHYPFLTIYPTAYPYNLDEIYPVSSGAQHAQVHGLQRHKNKQQTLLPEWPDFASLYPLDPSVERAAGNKSLPVELLREVNYPFLEIYRTAYPYNLEEIYPASHAVQPAHVRRPQHREVNQDSLLPEWPNFASLYPSDPHAERAAVNKSQHVTLPVPVGYPFLEIYPTAYPYNLYDIYPTSEVQSAQIRSPQRLQTKQHSLLPEWPDFASLYPSDSRVERAAANKSQYVTLPGPVGYPFLEVYPTAYPYNLDEIYPALVPRAKVRVSQRLETKQDSLLPDFASLYPSNPLAERAAANKSQHVTLRGPVGYPFLEIYPVAYPYNLEQIYPAISSVTKLTIWEGQSFTKSSGVTKVARKGLLPEWPDFASLYPADPRMERAASNKSLPVALHRPADYPFIVLYETVYPHNLDEVYPPVQSVPLSGSTSRPPVSTSRSNRETTTHGTLEYPDFAGLYPSDRTAERAAANKCQSVYLPYQGYPFISVYPSVYPWTLAEIYGPRRLTDVPVVGPHQIVDTNSLSVRLPVNSGYPAFNLYPAPSGFPAFEIYPPVVPRPLTATVPSVKLTPSHPATDDDGLTHANPPETPLPARPNSPRKRAQTPGPGRRRSHGMRSPLSPDSEVDRSRRSSRSSIQKDLALPPLPTATVKDASSPRKPRLTHLDLHRRVFGTGENIDVSENTIVPEKPEALVPKRRKTHDELHHTTSVSIEGSQGTDDFVAELPLRTAPSPAPSRQRSRSGTVSSRASTDVSRKGSQQSVDFVTELPSSSSPTPQDRKTHHDVRVKMSPEPSPEHTEGMEDFVAELPRRAPSSSATPVRQRSRSGTVSTRTSMDRSRKGSQGSANFITDIPRSSTPTAAPRRRKTHHELHQAVFANLSYENSQRLDDFVAELLPQAPAPSSPAPSRQRSRSGTVSGRTSQPPGPPPAFKPPSPPAATTGRARRPSVSTNFDASPSETSPSPVKARSSPLSPPSARTPFVSGLPGSPSPARESIVLSRVRSMNTPVRPTPPAPQATSAGGLDRSKSMSDSRRGHGGANRQSIVLERAKMFTLSEKGVEISDVLPPAPGGRPVSKLDRSKLPFT